MPSTLNGTGVTFNDATTLQSGNIPAANLGSGTANNTTFLRGDKTWQSPSGPPTLELLGQDTVASTGTWTKAGGYEPADTIIMFLIGGGGSGGVTTRNSAGSCVATGGASGDCQIIYGSYSLFPSTLYVVVGAGASAVSRTTGGQSNGTIGSISSLRTTSTSNVNLFNATGGIGGSGVIFTNQEAVFDPDPGITSQLSINFFAGAFRAGAREALGVDGFPVGGEATLLTDSYIRVSRANWLVSGGGGAAVGSTTGNQTVFNTPIPGLVNTGGLGSGTGNGVAGTLGSGGGGAATVTSLSRSSGAGGDGALIVHYYRGRVTPFNLGRVV
jgi:hypothetical protein